jgi:purine-cytosine permease-like protein
VKQLRRIHLYLGCFITPLLAVYLFSGFYFILKPERQKDEGEAQSLMQKLWWMHTDQQWPRGVSETIDPLSENQPKTITTWEANTTLFKWLIYLVVIFALATMALGLVLAIRSAKDKNPAIGAVIAGILIPILLLAVGQKQVKKPNPFHPDNAGGSSSGPGLAPPGSNIDPSDPGLSPLPGNPLPGNNEDGPSLLPPDKKKRNNQDNSPAA